MELNVKRFLEILFPLSEDEVLITSCTKENFAEKMRVHACVDIIALLSFADREVKAAIHLNKFHQNFHARRLLSAVLREYLATLGGEAYALIPIPLSSKRMRERGYNQVEIVAKEALRGMSHIQLHSKLLHKSKHTPPQTALSKEKRLGNLKGAFMVDESKAQLLRNTDVILLDDVVTTGTTLCEAKAALFPHEPASITCLALAH